MRLSVAIFFLANLCAQIAIPAKAESSNLEFAAAIGRQGYGRCHMDGCGFFVIDASAPIGSSKNGALFAVSQRNWQASYRRTEDEHEYDRKPISVSKPETMISLVFCSKTDPIVYDFFDGKWQGVRLRPGDADAVFGANESSYTFYYAACHNFITKDANLPAELAKKLGYNLHGGFPDGSNDEADPQPLDMIK
jgi:hypothetical protein